MSHKTWFRLDVTQADIDGGVCADSEKCVLARAINRALSKGEPEEIAWVDHISVDMHFPEIWGDLTLYFRDKKSYRDYIRQFDAGVKVTPTTFVAYATDLPERVVAILRDKGLLLDGEMK